jgi:hypothetical protein
MMQALLSSFACESSQQQTRPSPHVASVRAAAVYPKFKGKVPLFLGFDGSLSLFNEFAMSVLPPFSHEFENRS